MDGADQNEMKEVVVKDEEQKEKEENDEKKEDDEKKASWMQRIPMGWDSDGLEEIGWEEIG